LIITEEVILSSNKIEIREKASDAGEGKRVGREEKIKGMLGEVQNRDMLLAL